jgi:hypothetical protein
VADFGKAAKLHRLLDAIDIASNERRNVTPCDSDLGSWEA